jgi:hypothetical protein
MVRTSRIFPLPFIRRDINFHERECVVFGKGNRERSAEICPERHARRSGQTF